ncbi:MAG TPA: AMP-binding protein, partial [Methylophilaceae bacterium]|nr:AMP-binding protein [Methylophilaceae bacterium]
YHFAVGLAAAIVAGKVSLLPPTHTPEMLQQLKAFAADVFCLHDGNADTAALPLLRYPETSAPARAPFAVPQIAAEQLVAIVFTSGSTSAPLPHRKHWGLLVQNVRTQAERLRLDRHGQHALLATVPPQHMYGFESSILLPLLSGNSLCSQQPFYPADICNALSALPAPRILVSTPLHLRLLLDAGIAIPAADMLLSATAPLSLQLAQAAETRFTAPLVEIYGSTETGQIATRRTAQTAQWQLFPGVRLTQRDHRVWAAHGHIELPIALNDIIELVDETHFLLHGRLQDLVNIAGKRSSLANLNHHLTAIAGVLDGAFYMPEETSADQVTRLSACVVAPGLDAAAVLAALRERIDPVFLPRPLIFVDALPRNSTGKLPRAALQQLIESHGHHALTDTA